MSNAVRFDASADRLYRTASVVNFQQAYTVCCWFYVAVDLNDYGVIYTVNADTTTNRYEYVGVDADGTTLSIASKHSSNAEVAASGSTLTVGTWYHLAIVRSSISGTLTLYLDGVQDAQLTNDLTGSFDCQRMEFGGFSTNNFSPVNGRVAYARAWQAALTAGEIQTEMNAASAQKASPWGDWPLQTDYADISGNGRDWSTAGTLTFEDGPTLSGGGTTYDEAGQATSVSTASGSDAATLPDAGQAASPLTATGSDAAILVDAGQAASTGSAAGLDTVTLADVGEATIPITASAGDAGAFVDAGQAASAGAASGVDALTLVDAGEAASALTASGTESLFSGASDAGEVASSGTAGGLDVLTSVDAGQAATSATATARDTVLYLDAADVIVIAVASGSDGTVVSTAGTMTLTRSAPTMTLIRSAPTLTIEAT